MQRQLELVQEVIERERRLQTQLAGHLLAPVDVIFDLLEESGSMLRGQAEALEAAGRALEETARLKEPGRALRTNNRRAARTGRARTGSSGTRSTRPQARRSPIPSRPIGLATDRLAELTFDCSETVTCATTWARSRGHGRHRRSWPKQGPPQSTASARPLAGALCSSRRAPSADATSVEQSFPLRTLPMCITSPTATVAVGPPHGNERVSDQCSDACFPGGMLHRPDARFARLAPTVGPRPRLCCRPTAPVRSEWCGLARSTEDHADRASEHQGVTGCDPAASS